VGCSGEKRKAHQSVSLHICIRVLTARLGDGGGVKGVREGDLNEENFPRDSRGGFWREKIQTRGGSFRLGAHDQERGKRRVGPQLRRAGVSSRHKVHHKV